MKEFKKLKNAQEASVGENVERTGLCALLVRRQARAATVEVSLEGPQQVKIELP